MGNQAPEGLCSRCLVEDLLAPEYVAEIDSSLDSGTSQAVIRYFGDYEFLEPLSRGGMGMVFKARQVSLNRLVAVKLVNAGRSANPAAKKRFQTEAETAARLHHPHIIPIYEYGEYGGEYFLSMKLIEKARSLVELRLSARETVGQVIHITEAIHYAHQRGVLHRDIKPSNILCGEDGICYLTDFGLAKLVDSDAGLTLTSEFLGTPAYMAPEQIRSGSSSGTTAVDIYSLGATLYESFSGSPPFEAESIPELLRKIVEEEPPPLTSPEVDADLQTICLKCLEKDPSRRYDSAANLAEDLSLWHDRKPIQARPVTTVERLVKWSRRKPALAALAVTATLAVLTILIGIAWFNFRLRDKNEEIVSQVIRLSIENGTRLDSEGDPTRAMLYFVEALRLAETSRNQNEVEMLRLRFDSLLRRVPRLAHIWVHEGGANDVQFSPDGKRVLSAGNDGKAHVFEVTSGLPVSGPLVHDAPVLKASFSPNGQYIVTLTTKEMARLWRASNGVPVTESLISQTPYWLWKFGPAAIGFDSEERYFGRIVPEGVGILEISNGRYRVISPSSGSPRFLAFRPGTNLMAIATQQGLEFWDISKTAPLRVIPTSGTLRWIGFSGDGRRLLGIGPMGVTRVWDNLDSEPVAFEFESAATAAVVDAGFLEGGREAYTFNFVSAVRLWDLQHRGSSRSFMVPGAAGARTLRNSNRFATFGMDGSVSFFDGEGTPIGAQLWHAGAIAACSTDASGGRLATACQDGSVRLWELPLFNLPPAQLGHWGQLSISAFSQDGRFRLTCNGGKTLHLYDRDGVREIKSFQAAERVIRAGLGPSGETLAAVSWNLEQNKMFFDLWSCEGNQHTRLPPPGDPKPGYHCFRFQSGQVAVGFTGQDQRGGAEILDERTGACKVSGFNHKASVRAIDLDPSGTRLLTGSDDGTARVWDAQTGKPISAPLEHGSPLNVVRFSPDGRRFVTATSDDTFLPRYAQIWSSESFKPLTPKLWHQDGVLDAVFSPDGKILATAGEDSVLQLWDSESGAPLTPRLRQSQKVDCLSFSPDGKLLLISCRSAYLRVFHSITGEPVTDPIPHGASEAFPTFLPDSKAISFAGPDGRPIDLPIGSCGLNVSELRTIAEMLSNHTLSGRGLQRLDLPVVQAAKARLGSWNSSQSR